MGGGSNHYKRAEKMRQSDAEDSDDNEEVHCCDKPCWRSKTNWMIVILTIVVVTVLTLLLVRK